MKKNAQAGQGEIKLSDQKMIKCPYCESPVQNLKNHLNERHCRCGKCFDVFDIEGKNLALCAGCTESEYE